VRKLFLILLFVLIPLLGYAGTSYYVDCEDAGTDSGTFANPWQSIAKVNDQSFSTGDDVYLAVNTTCNSTEEFQITWSGTSGDWVVIGAYYGDGQFGLNGNSRPIINASGVGSYPSYLNAIEVVRTDYSASYVKIADLRVEESPSYGIVYSKTNNFEVDNCYVYRSKRQGIIISKTHTGTVSDNTVQEASYLTSPGAGIEIHGGQVIDLTYGVTVTRNTVFHSYEGIGFYGKTRNSTMEYNISYDNRLYHLYIASSSLNVMRYNIAYESVDYGPPGGEPDGKERDVMIAVDNEHHGAITCYNTGNEVYGNLVAGGKTGIHLQCTYCIEVPADNCGLTNTKVYNNTIVDMTQYNIRVYAQTGDWSGNEIKNNVSWTLSGGNHISPCAPTGVTFDYNLWDEDPGTGNCDDAQDPANASPDLAQSTGWQSMTAGSVDGTEFQPNSGSPAIGAGVDLGEYNLPFQGSTWPDSVSVVDADGFWDLGGIMSGPIVTITAPDSEADEATPGTGTFQIACSPNCDSETITWSINTGTATLSTDQCSTDSAAHDFKMDDEDGTSAFVGASTTITLTACDDTADEPTPETIIDDDDVDPPPTEVRTLQNVIVSGVKIN
jgi:parallel beta-helix repeat protein